ncbi:ExbD/TolR family protein [Niabella ginsengisoli]|uniref:Biopolymer transporter ExbD n=1 Tax=Niabella ginsengisoli TaxID=522298 RepID=A0ABS9SE64_9BACT|nr:biopolymer transporter ExbD [Niabella ginsengisoli]MCH5596648.1 biopolymer transporter ExbD [Niabella ginsengisoli]
MTPMVDLGFLLITFFIFTATMSSPTTMDLNMPKDNKNEEDQTKVKQSGALTIMVGKDNNLFYYEGELAPDGSNFQSTNFKEIRSAIIKKKKQVEASYVTDAACEAKARQEGKNPADCRQKDFFVLIKPTEEANYKNVIDLLDEMTINKVARYALIDPFDTEKDLITASQGSAPAAAPPAQ